MANYYDDPTLQQAQVEAQTAGSSAVAYQSAASQLPAKLKEAVMGKLDYNKDLIEQKNKAQAQYFQAPSEARENIRIFGTRLKERNWWRVKELKLINLMLI